MSKKIYQEHHLRSIVKAITWRITGTLDTLLISFIITGKLEWAIKIGFVELFTTMMLYYLHKRIRDKIKTGKGAKEIEYNI